MSSSQNKDQKDSGTGVKLARRGIPLASGDAQLQSPPPWAYPLQPDVQQPNTQQLLRTASKAIDLAMAHLWETKLKVVDVSFSVQTRKQETLGEERAAFEGKGLTRNELPQVSQRRNCDAPDTETTCECVGTVSGNNMLAHDETPIGERVGPDDNSTLYRIGESQISPKDSAMKVRPRGIDEVEDIRTGQFNACCQITSGGDSFERSIDGGSLQVQGNHGDRLLALAFDFLLHAEQGRTEEERRNFGSVFWFARFLSWSLFLLSFVLQQLRECCL
jgi:hypothetical protein